MHPRLFEIGQEFTVYSYGVMLALAVVVGGWLFSREVKRRHLDPELWPTIPIITLLGGVVGSKILYVIENWGEFKATPATLWSQAGMTFYGGFIMAVTFVSLYARAKKIAFFTIADAVAPGLIIGYGIGRLGCHLSGDGDYGLPSDLPWATDYSKGTYPPSRAFVNLPEVADRFPGAIVPDTTLCHPTPVYEFLLSIIIGGVLWRYRTRLNIDGQLFMVYLVLSGLERFIVEFLRINPHFFLSLSLAQV